MKAFLFEVQSRRSYGLSETCQDTVLGVITYFREHVPALAFTEAHKNNYTAHLFCHTGTELCSTRIMFFFRGNRTTQFGYTVINEFCLNLRISAIVLN